MIATGRVVPGLVGNGASGARGEAGALEADLVRMGIALAFAADGAHADALFEVPVRPLFTMPSSRETESVVVYSK